MALQRFTDVPVEQFAGDEALLGPEGAEPEAIVTIDGVAVAGNALAGGPAVALVDFAAEFGVHERAEDRTASLDEALAARQAVARR
jgi:hypothetical protein